MTIIISGGVKSGKSSLAKFILADYINRKIRQKRFIVEKIGKEVAVIDTFTNNKNVNLDYPNPQSENLFSTYGVKIYRYADEAKEFLINTMGLDRSQLYGTESDILSDTHILWDDQFEEIKLQNKRGRNRKIPTGFMSAKEVLNVICKDVIERFDVNCWQRSLASKIEEDNFNLSIVEDAYNSGQITVGSENGAKTIRLSKNEASMQESLRDLPFGEFSLILDNNSLTMIEAHKKAKIKIDEWTRNI